MIPGKGISRGKKQKTSKNSRVQKQRIWWEDLRIMMQEGWERDIQNTDTIIYPEDRPYLSPISPTIDVMEELIQQVRRNI